MEARSGMGRRALSVLVVMAMLAGCFTIVNVSRVATAAPAPMYTVTTGYALNEDFSEGNMNDWTTWKAHPTTTINATSGILELNNAGWAGYWVRHQLNLSKQDYNITFDFRISSDQAPEGDPAILLLESGFWYAYPVSTYSNTAVIIKLHDNRSLELNVDNGAKTYPATIIAKFSAPLPYNLNFRFNLTVWGWNDTGRLRVQNISSSGLFYTTTFTTFDTYSFGETHMPTPDRLAIGNIGEFANVKMHAFYDNISVTFQKADHAGLTLDSADMDASIIAYANQLMTLEYSTGKYRLGYSMENSNWATVPSYYLTASTVTTGRDDVAAQVIEQLALLYKYRGMSEYLDMAEEVWSVLQTHRQPDGGWTFGSLTTDFSDGDSSVILALKELYFDTADAQYVTDIVTTADWLLDFQNDSGMVYGTYNRTTLNYGQPEITWFTGLFVVAMISAYEVTADTDYRDAAVVSIGWLLNRTAVSGRCLSPPLALTAFNPDLNDVSNAGMTLWALSEAYDVLGTASYLTEAGYIAKWLVNSEWCKSGYAWGVWTGLAKDRLNQSDLLYTYPVLRGLSVYLKSTTDTEAAESFYAALNWQMSRQGTSTNVNSLTLYGYTGVWGASYNFNSTTTPGWTRGWFAEGGWGTWGLIVFYGWQCQVVTAMMQYLTTDGMIASVHQMSSMIGMAVTMVLLGIVVSVVVSDMRMFNNPRMSPQAKIQQVIKSVVFIVIGLTMWGLLYAVAYG